MLEAMASGLPGRGFPRAGPLDVLTDPRVGVMSEDLGQAARAALELSREDAPRLCADLQLGVERAPIPLELAPFDAAVCGRFA